MTQQIKHFSLVLAAGALARIFLVYKSCIWDSQQVGYTDVDYHVFTDAAKYLSLGLSPYNHTTYRYPPILAWICYVNLWVGWFGKALFCVADLANSYLLFKQTSSWEISAVYWLNPLIIYLASRGSFDSLIVLVLLLFVMSFQRKLYFISGIIYGFSIHLRIFPVIFAVPIIFSFYKTTKKLISREILTFALGALLSLAVSTIVSQLLYPQFIQQAVLYHLKRIDHRHSYSPYFLQTYLSMGTQTVMQKLVPLVLQASLLFSAGVYLYHDFPLCLMSQTWIFILFNKVYTLQYMAWLSIGLLAMPRNLVFLEGRRRALFSFGMTILLGLLVWWYFALKLEGQGKDYLIELWLSSLGLTVSQSWVLHRIVSLQLGQRQLADFNKKKNK